jgi:hypothetical protein
MRYLSSLWVTGSLVLLLIVSISIELRLRSKWWVEVNAGKRSAQGRAEAAQLAHAFEQYLIDFPDAGRPINNREWTERLGGRNPKAIKYFKVDIYSHNSAGRLLDPCGRPWIIVSSDSPDFDHNPTVPESGSEFEIKSEVCPGNAFGNPNRPHFLRP